MLSQSLKTSDGFLDNQEGLDSDSDSVFGFGFDLILLDSVPIRFGLDSAPFEWDSIRIRMGLFRNDSIRIWIRIRLGLITFDSFGFGFVSGYSRFDSVVIRFDSV